MPFVTKEQINIARELDLLTYMERYNPNELVRISPRVYSLRSHSSVKISNGLWCRWSSNTGGRSALDYFIKVENMSLPDAVQMILQHTRTPTCEMPHTPSHRPQPISRIDKPQFILPPKNKNNYMLIRYLSKRGIHQEILSTCINDERIYESCEMRKSYGREIEIHNVIFV